MLQGLPRPTCMQLKHDSDQVISYRYPTGVWPVSPSLMGGTCDGGVGLLGVGHGDGMRRKSRPARHGGAAPADSPFIPLDVGGLVHGVGGRERHMIVTRVHNGWIEGTLGHPPEGTGCKHAKCRASAVKPSVFRFKSRWSMQHSPAVNRMLFEIEVVPARAIVKSNAFTTL